MSIQPPDPQHDTRPLTPALAPVLAPVAVLLAVHNGEPWLDEQIDSVLAQQGVAPRILAGNDGSSDGSAALLARRLQGPGSPHGVLELQHRHPTPSFMALLRHALQRWPDLHWFAFCDQDDIWLPDKLARAVRVLGPHTGADATPALYGARTVIVDRDNRPMGLSRLHAREPAFRNAIVQNILPGNTMVFNRAAAELLDHTDPAGLQSHDWWTYMLVSGAGGRVVYDPEPCLRYRQHGGNQLGSNQGVRAAARRLRMFWRGDFRLWNRRHIEELRRLSPLLAPHARALVEHWSMACTAPGALQRLRELRLSGVWRQLPREQAMLVMACLTGRLA